MDIKEALKDMRLKFTSSNSVAVDRTTVLREAYREITEYIEDQDRRIIKITSDFQEAMSKAREGMNDGH